jgi:membrane protease YdiL (CAAX protease family)
MSQFQLSFLLAFLCVAGVTCAGYRPYIVEFRGWPRQVIAAFLLTGVLAFAVFLPVTSFGKADEIDPDTIWFPSLLAGHFLLATFLLLWWRLRADTPLASFLKLTRGNWWAKIRTGAAVGCGGWVATVTVTGTAAGLFALTGRTSGPSAVSPLIVWLAELPLLDRLIMIGVAMTVEEAFFRGFLQPRFGLVLSSVLFALSHFSYGLPFMIVGVFTISLIIGRTFKRSGDLLPCVVAHGIFDAVQLLIVLPLAVRALPSAGTP